MRTKHANAMADAKRLYARRKHRSNVKTKTLSDLPRLLVKRSNQYIYAQVIDRFGKVLASANDVKITSGNKSTKSLEVGKTIAQKVLDA